ncbi:MAG: DUF6298 domain-containing protein [Acidobacteriota bacterium]|nr:DUF6298 domain-containing protein [Acidobacteriota bacterium]
MKTATLFAVLTLLPGCLAAPSQILRIHPDNPKYFLFRGKPLFLLTATEHYGSVINRPFDFEKYLADAAVNGMTMTRTFLLFRELQSARNPSSPCKPESPDYIAPFPRTGPGKALDGEPRYDLDQWNPEYFDRLHRFLESASRRGIVVELTIFSNTYADQIWALNPFRAKNNLQAVGDIEWQEYNTLKNQRLVERQVAYARKIVQETAAFDNVYYEICNEPGGGFAGHATPADVDEWQEHIGRVVGEEMARLGRVHLIAGQQAFSYKPEFRSPYDNAITGKLFDLVNVHPLPGTVFAGVTYQLGNFMSKELMLDGISKFSRAMFPAPKPVILDEDNTASIYRDLTGWTIHRKRAWTALLNAAHYDYIDFSITVGSETGTRESSAGLRSWMKHLSRFVADFDFVHAKPLPNVVLAAPANTLVSVLARSGESYAVYVADAREINEPQAGRAIQGKLALDLPAGRYALRLYSPVEGTFSPAILVDGKRGAEIDLAPFRHDIALRLDRVPATGI